MNKLLKILWRSIILIPFGMIFLYTSGTVLTQQGFIGNIFTEIWGLTFFAFIALYIVNPLFED